MWPSTRDRSSLRRCAAVTADMATSITWRGQVPSQARHRQVTCRALHVRVDAHGHPSLSPVCVGRQPGRAGILEEPGLAAEGGVDHDVAAAGCIAISFSAFTHQ